MAGSWMFGDLFSSQNDSEILGNCSNANATVWLDGNNSYINLEDGEVSISYILIMNRPFSPIIDVTVCKMMFTLKSKVIVANF